MAESTRERNNSTPLFLTASIFIAVVLFAPVSSNDFLSLSSFFSMAASSAGAAWLFHTAGYWAGFATAIPAYLLGWYLTGSPVTAVASILFLPGAITYAMVSKRRLTRSYAVGISALIVSVTLLALLLQNVYAISGQITLSSVNTVYSPFFDQLKTTMEQTVVVTIAGREVSYITSANAEQYVNLLLGLTPGILALLSSSLGFLSGWLYKALLGLTHFEKPDIGEWKLLPTPISAAFFCISLLVYTVSGTVTFVWLTAANLALILMPGFVFAGFASATEIRMIDGFPRPRILRPLLFLLAFFSGLGVFICVAAFFGVLDSIKAILPKRKREDQ